MRDERLSTLKSPRHKKPRYQSLLAATVGMIDGRLQVTMVVLDNPVFYASGTNSADQSVHSPCLVLINHCQPGGQAGTPFNPPFDVAKRPYGQGNTNGRGEARLSPARMIIGAEPSALSNRKCGSR